MDANAETANVRSIPPRSFWFGKAFDETAECPNGGIGGSDVLGNFKMRRPFPSLPSDVEDNHPPAKRLYERLKIMLRIDVEIDV